jgi:hypothetical protein
MQSESKIVDFNDFDGLATGDIGYLPASSSGIQFFNHGISFAAKLRP